MLEKSVPVFIISNNGPDQFKAELDPAVYAEMVKTDPEPLAGFDYGDVAATVPYEPRPRMASYGYFHKFIIPKYPGNIHSAAAPNWADPWIQSHWDSITGHRGRNDVAFCDGHVKSLDAKAMLADDL